MDDFSALGLRHGFDFEVDETTIWEDILTQINDKHDRAQISLHGGVSIKNVKSISKYADGVKVIRDDDESPDSTITIYLPLESIVAVAFRND